VRQTSIIAALSLALTGTAFAQTGQKSPPEPCVKGNGNSGDLSNKLGQSNGVICRRTSIRA
jgi:hypothetical protein